jgi:hypothetical protein
MRPLQICLLAAFAAVCGSCIYKPVPESELLGDWRAELPDGGFETLKMLPAGRCMQQVHLRDGKTYSAEGSWEYLPPNNHHLYLRGLRDSLGSGDDASPKLFGLDVYRTLFGAPRIYLSESTYYCKQY